MSYDRGQLAKVLLAYVERLPLKDLYAIVECQENAWHAGMNLGMRAQLEAHEKAVRSCEQAVEHIGSHDLGLISAAIEQAAGGQV
ncbi:hypothetical protein AB4Y36_38165 [Paraburkholderia sp. BR10936]|uniref:hypothetical protein n=1 Tax=Paraburkholderia sp. BR10936 TaxID=3236993 RepID=UPI0034D1FD6D